MPVYEIVRPLNELEKILVMRQHISLWRLILLKLGLVKDPINTDTIMALDTVYKRAEPVVRKRRKDQKRARRKNRR